MWKSYCKKCQTTPCNTVQVCVQEFGRERVQPQDLLKKISTGLKYPPKYFNKVSCWRKGGSDPLDPPPVLEPAVCSRTKPT